MTQQISNGFSCYLGWVALKVKIGLFGKRMRKEKRKKKFFHFGFPFEKFKTENKVEVAQKIAWCHVSKRRTKILIWKCQAVQRQNLATGMRHCIFKCLLSKKLRITLKNQSLEFKLLHSNLTLLVKLLFLIEIVMSSISTFDYTTADISKCPQSREHCWLIKKIGSN